MRFSIFGRKNRVVTMCLLLLISTFASFSLLIRPAESEVSWWDTNWNFRRQITVGFSQVTVDLQDFPVLVDLTDANLAGKARTSGGDIVFVDTNNKTLSHEIESYNSTSGHLVAWVRMPMLSSSQDTVFYMYYGNGQATGQSNSTAVWDSGFVMVQHLEELSGARNDSTAHVNNAAVIGSVGKSSGGKIDGADNFNGNGYEKVQQGFLPTSAITVELWFKPTVYSATSYTKFVNTGPQPGWGIYGTQSSKTADKWALGMSWNSGAKSLSTGDIVSGYAWNYVAMTWDGAYCTAYVNGVKVKDGTIAGIADWAGMPLYLGANLYGNERFNGNIDEVRVSNMSRSTAWIQTSYNCQNNPQSFCILGIEEQYSSAPIILEADPPNGKTEVYTNPTLSVRVSDPNVKLMSIIFREEISNAWFDLQRYDNATDGTYKATSTHMKNLGTTYYWSVSVSNGESWTNSTFSFTTTSKILTPEWNVTGVPLTVSGVLIADVNNDSIQEVIQAGLSGVICLKGTDGSVVWNKTYTGMHIGDSCQPEMADLNRDGILEIVVPLESPAGLLVLHANDGTIYWSITSGLGKDTFGGPVIFDIDGNGYPTIFMGSEDVSNGVNGTGRITAISYDGRILRQTFAWRPCSGGLSIADTDGDGQFELYMGDRYMYLNSTEYGDNDYGKGVQSYWATNLTLRWFRSDIFCSSQKPMLADVNHDGKLEVVIGDMNGGAAVLNASDGSMIRISQPGSTVLPVHYQPSVYDIDNDGNLEMIMADPHDDPLDPVNAFSSDDIVVFDLSSWKEDARIYLGKCFYGPQVADVTGDGKMEIVAVNYRSIIVLDAGGNVLCGVTGLTGNLNYAVAQDIDGDGYTELIVASRGGVIYAFHTPARTPLLRPRTEVHFYSEYRLGAAEYVPPLLSKYPLVFYRNPADQAEEVPLSLSQLEFSLTDYQQNHMNYTVTTNPFTGSGTGTNVANGKYTVPVSGLAPSTTYTWKLSITDGTNWTNSTYTFRTESIAPWWNLDWKNRKKISIDHTMVMGDLINFPVLINITNDGDLASNAKKDGGDIVFTDEYGLRLNHEIEAYDGNSGSLIAWVGVPSVSTQTDTGLFMYYNNSAAGNMQTPSQVWDSSFVMVQHLEELSGTRNDSTANVNNAAVIGSVGKSSGGKIDGADNFNGNGYEKVQQGFLPTSAITVELWFKPTIYSATSYTKFVNTGPQPGWGIYGTQSSKTADKWALGMSWNSGTKSLSTGDIVSGYAWNYVAITWDGTYCAAYLNGVKVKDNTITGTPDWTGTPLYVGANLYGNERFNGNIDEIRISKMSRTASWIQTSYNNQKDPTKFCKPGTQEGISDTPPIVFAPTPANKANNISPTQAQLSFNITNNQGSPMDYYVTTYPNIGSGSGTGVPSGRYAINASGLQYLANYAWNVSVTDGTRWTNLTFVFSTLPSSPPVATNDPTLQEGPDGNIICNSQTITDPDSNVTFVYDWIRNGIPAANLLLPFDTNSSTIVKDYSGYNNDGTIVGGVTWTTNGKVGGAYKFDNGFIQIPGSNILDGGRDWQAITVEEWIYLSQNQTNTRTIARIPSFELRIAYNQIVGGIWIDPKNPGKSSYNRIYGPFLQTNTWYHIALTYQNSTGITLYVNGNVVATAIPSVWGNIQAGDSPTYRYPLYIGWFDYFHGMIDDVRIYPKSLSPQQIYQQYLETKDGLCNSSTIVSQETQASDVWRCFVTPNDSNQDGTGKSSNMITIGVNNRPIAEKLAITPQSPKTTDDLVASYIYFDPDGDPENGTEIRWYKNGILQPNLNNTLTVSSTLTTKGETWFFTVRPSDGKDFGDLQISSATTIQNSPPSITSVSITPNPANTTNTLTANPASPYDADGDSITFTYQWQKYENGSWTNIVGATNQTLEPGSFMQGDQIRVICAPYDGQDYGLPKEDALTIL